jgi:hypothetical protein
MNIKDNNMLHKIKTAILLFLLVFSLSNCDKEVTPPENNNGLIGFSLLNELTGHWVGSNQTAYGFYDWFSFDFRPISPSHLHSIYEGGTNQNIITSIFVADHEGKKQIMARNGGWLGNQYRATYFVLDKAEVDGQSKYYRLVDAVGKEKRAFIEFKFENDTLYFDAYKDNSGSLDDPIHHMGFKGTNYNPSYAQPAVDLFNFPQEISEVDLEDQFLNLIDPNSALFLEENEDPFPKELHGHLSDLKISINRGSSILEDKLLLYISKESIVNMSGQVDFDNLNEKVIRTIDVRSNETSYEVTYLHPDNYFITAFSDIDDNKYPSSGDISSESILIEVAPESNPSMEINVERNIQ